MKKLLLNCKFIILVGMLGMLMNSGITLAKSTTSIVHAILFYSPTCPHCHKVIDEVLPPLIEKYNEQLIILGIDVSQPEGQQLYQDAIQQFSIPENRLGVPTLIIGENVLVGSIEIPELFPNLVDHYLAQNGVDWPDIPGLTELLQTTSVDIEPTETSEPLATAEQVIAVSTEISTEEIVELEILEIEDISWRDKIALDPIGNGFAIVVLAGMLASIIWAVILFKNHTGLILNENLRWLIPVLCTIGFVVAGYLTYVETAQVSAICGPVGDCNTVQQSQYARLFGIMPIGFLGLIGYASVLISWIIFSYTKGIYAFIAGILLLIETSFGVLFSIYLTFLEPFVIGATCMWCLTSSFLITSLMLFSIRPALLGFSNIKLLFFFKKME